ncbi:hypothetical protein M758_3G051500 [Ceratodon purpureus]|uniref:Uncharacterized protein n=1 Tax=Ceratodon purpureus TaxID=3225 RepID=A0A8T0IIR3_CERPU|nr:hypothetical protein KC19_3G053400 [Ceratodon purpureus]KAG0621828.1 hypothetical protein M758_3G051500 [Ceratodon purpureus]
MFLSCFLCSLGLLVVLLVEGVGRTHSHSTSVGKGELPVGSALLSGADMYIGIANTGQDV